MESLKELLGSTIRVKITDGRVVEGQLQCIDKSVNIVVAQAKEFHGMNTIEDSAETAELTRNVGMAVIRGNDIVSVIRRKNVDNSYNV